MRLDDLIGDRTGNTFRKFAQGLTLDRLLKHANTRLADLKPRFTLERAAGGDMLIQVIDNDMGGGVRGLHNLSGGERFLVSLALALGLAELSTAKGCASRACSSTKASARSIPRAWVTPSPYSNTCTPPAAGLV